MPVTLREYQIAAVSAIRQEFSRGTKQTVLVSPTGSGKTTIFAHIAHNSTEKHKKICILVHRRELLRQVCRALEAEGQPYGVINTKFTPDFSQPVQVATVQTLARRLNIAPQFDLIIADESHHVISAQWLSCIGASPNARVLGVTATPCRLDGRGLGDVFHSMVMGPTVQNLIDWGNLAPIELYAPRLIDTDGVGTANGDYIRADLAVASDTPKITGDAIAHYRKYADGEPAIVYCVNVEHAHHVAAQFREAGYSFWPVDGKMDDVTRDDRITGLGSRYQGLTSCDLISEGLDVPCVSVGIMLRPTKSVGLWLQQCGRILRPMPGKTRALILDHAGNYIRHGHPAEDRTWSLDSKKKRASGESQRTMSLTQCPKCYYVHEPAPVCPACGHVYENKRAIEHVDGELHRVGVGPPKPVYTPEQKRAFAASCRTLDDFRAVAKLLDYKPGWAYYKWEARNGRHKKSARAS